MLIDFYNGLTGITEIVVIGANVAVILVGWLQEVMTRRAVPRPRFCRSGTTVLPFWFSCIAGIAPWGVIVIDPFGSTDRTTKEVPTFVFGIVISRFAYITNFAQLEDAVP